MRPEIQIENLSYDKYIAGLDISDIDARCEEKYQLSHSSTVKGSLKRHVRFWKSIGANPDIIDCIVGGYKLPIIELPEIVYLQITNQL